MAIRELGYLIIEATDIDAWSRFAGEILGLAVTKSPQGHLFLKMDERDFRFIIVPAKVDRLAVSGWGVTTKAEFDATRERLSKLGFEPTDGTADERRHRKVQGLFWVIDPEGARHEIFWGPIAAWERFVSPVGVSRFVTGELGMGHTVVPAMNFSKTQDFWTKGMGFGLSDILHLELSSGTRTRIHFFHCDNGRQHSMAMVELPSQTACHHLMIEVASLDDVGFALDRVQASEFPILMTLGRHVNDKMVSFYFVGPGGIAFEIGCGGVVMEWDKHTVFETTRGSHWGHKIMLPDLT